VKAKTTLRGRAKHVLIEIAEDRTLPVAERLDAIGQVLEMWRIDQKARERFLDARRKRETPEQVKKWAAGKVLRLVKDNALGVE
jgi:hypothetical protein